MDDPHHHTQQLRVVGCMGCCKLRSSKVLVVVVCLETGVWI
jgi:hypothetical protein